MGDVVADPSGSWEPSTAQAYIDQQVATLNTSIASETIARQTGDNNLSTQLTSEMNTRASQDANLNALINAGIREGGGVQFDIVPTQNSANGITSGGMYNTLRDSNVGFVDEEPVVGSNNLVKSGGVELITRSTFSNMIEFGCSLKFAAGETYKDFNLDSFFIKGGTKILFFVDRPDIVYSVRFIKYPSTSNITVINDELVSGKVISEQDTTWDIFRVVLKSAQQSDITVKINVCDSSKTGIPQIYNNLMSSNIPDAISTLFNNNFCFIRNGNTVDLTIQGTTVTLSSGTKPIVLVYQTSQFVALNVGESVSFSISRTGILYYLVYNIDNNAFYLRQNSQVNVYYNELILGALITSQLTDSDAVFDYFGFYNIKINGLPSYGSKQLSSALENSISPKSKLSLASIIPIVKGNRLEIFRDSISTEVYPIFDIQAIAPSSDNIYGRFRSNGYICDTNSNSTEFSITFNLVDYMATSIVSSVSTMIKPIAKKSSPSSNKNILVIGDSYTYINTWVQELSRRLKGTGGSPSGDGLNNLTFIGTQVTSGIPCEGYSSKDYSFFVGNESPFYYNGSINISSYVSSHGYNSIDYVLILLGCNGDTSLSNVRTLINSFITYKSDIKIIIGSNSMKYNQWGWETVSLRAGMKSSVWRDWYDWNNSLMNMINTEYSNNVFYIDIPSQIDIENNFIFEMGNANNRNSEVKIRYGVNNVHPGTSAYYQIADAFYNAFHYWCLD